MSGRRFSTRQITLLGVLAAVALALGYLESLIPIAAAAPGVKLGLSNTVLLYALYFLDAPSAVILMLLKVVLGGLLYSGVTAMLYSLAGGAASFAAMLLMRRVRGMGVVGVSVTGAVMHNAAQLAVASFIVGTRAVVGYLPVLLVAAAVTGTLTGITAKLVMRALRPHEKKNDAPPEDER